MPRTYGRVSRCAARSVTTHALGLTQQLTITASSPERYRSGLLVEDNIGNDAGTLLMVAGASGSVFSYNYMINSQSQAGFLTAGMLLHGGSPTMNLFEGNWAPKCGFDDTEGSAGYNTAFRNRFVGTDDGVGLANGDIQPIEVMWKQRHTNIVANVAGTPGKNTWYEQAGPGPNCHDGTRAFFIGSFAADCNNLSQPWDALTYSTLLRACNWDSATNGIPSGTCAAAPASVPASLYLDTKPTWFGHLRWPAVDPTDPTYSMTRTNIPAGYRFINGRDPT
jgi:hypothetical protein